MDWIGRGGVRAAMALLTALVVAAPLGAQTSTGGDPRGLHATRAELEALLVDAERRVDGLTGEHQVAARAEADALRGRLQEGDFRAGDEVTLYIDGHPDLSRQYTVEPDRSMLVPGIGSVPLRGVLRSELESHVTNYLGHYVRNPNVRATSTIRLVVMGGVGSPGFYSVPSSALLTDVLNTAGGTGHRSRLTHIRVERDGRRFLQGQPLQDAIIAGHTLDQLNIRAGDRIVVPERGTRHRALEILSITGAAAGSIWAIIRLTRRY